VLTLSRVREEVSARLTELTAHTSNLEPSILVSAEYDGDLRRVILKFYSPNSQRVLSWQDNTGHRPYCLSKEPPDSLRRVLGHRTDVLDIVVVEKIDPFTGAPLLMSKVIVTDPLAIGGAERGIRDVIQAYEADIKYYENYIYDNRLIPGNFYKIVNNRVIPVEPQMDAKERSYFKSLVEASEPELAPYIKRWFETLNQPLIPLKFASLDIEVASDEFHVPDPSRARENVVAAAVVGSDGRSVVFLLRREGAVLGEDKVEGAEVRLFDDESEMLANLFKLIVEYPVIVTFNGDDFDFPYLRKRAQNLGFRSNEIPISIRREGASIKHGIHIDLYKIFTNNAIKVYVFDMKYVENTLGSISEALLDESKMEFEGSILSLPLYKLANYCLTDARLVYKLVRLNDDVIFRLLLVIARVAKMPVDDVARSGVSRWIRSTMYYEHRLLNYLIPLSEEVAAKGRAVSQPITKGKKYRGGYVLEPESGVHFNVAVLDFASLYPSIIKVHNLSYETILCNHEECKSNIVPGTVHWVCRKRRGLTSLVIGALRDLRVKYYKPLSKQRDITPSRALLLNSISQVLKVILNASYGVFGTENFPLYCPPVAESTAAIGRYVISWTIERCKEGGIKVIYGDSVSGDTEVLVRNDMGDPRRVRIKETFVRVDHVTPEGKEYYYPKNLHVLSLIENGKGCWSKVSYVMRHKAGKRMYRVWITDSWHVDVTEDHSLVGYLCEEVLREPLSVERLREVRPTEIGKLTNFLVALKAGGASATPSAGCGVDFEVVRVARVEEIDHDGYVYDFEVEKTHRFFANGVLVHNTDSIFLSSPTREQINEMMSWSEKTLGIELDVDKEYRYVAFSSRKKNYLGVLPQGYFVLKGFTGKKSNTPAFIREAFYDVVRMLSKVKSKEEFETAREAVKKLLRERYELLKARKVRPEDISFNVMLSKKLEDYKDTKPQHVKAAQLLRSKGKEVRPGDIISFVKTTTSLGVKPLSLVRPEEIDVEKYVDCMKSTFEQLLDALGYNFDEILAPRRLEDFFSI